MTTTYETKTAHIQAIRNGDLIAIRDWFDCKSQNDYAVEKLAIDVLLKMVEKFQAANRMAEEGSKQDLATRLAVHESGMRVIGELLKEPVGQAVTVIARYQPSGSGVVLAYNEDDIDMMVAITEMASNIDDSFLDGFAEEIQRQQRKRRAAETTRRKRGPSAS